jgi:hypothetical protein
MDDKARAAYEIHRQYLVPVSVLAPLLDMSYQGLQKKWESMGLKDLGFSVAKQAMTPVSPNEAIGYKGLYELGFAIRSIARIFGRSALTVHLHLKAQGVDTASGAGGSLTRRLPFSKGD